jgi:hypothetical protein
MASAGRQSRRAAARQAPFAVHLPASGTDGALPATGPLLGFGPRNKGVNFAATGGTGDRGASGAWRGRGGGAQEFVAELYASLVDTTQPGGLARISGPEERRRYFTERLAAVFEANDARGGPCIHFAPGLDAQDWDGPELARTLVLSTQEAEEGAEVVTARFSIFCALARSSGPSLPRANGC